MSKGGGLVTEQQSNFGIHIDEPNVASNGTVTQNIIIGDKDILSFSPETNEQAGSSALIFERDSRSDGHCFDSLSYQYKCKLLNVPYTNHPNTDWVFNNSLDISSSTFDIIFESSSPQVGQHAISVFAENDLIDTDKSSLNLYVGSTTIDGIASTAGISIQVDDKAEDKQAKLTFMQANGENDIINVTLDQLALKTDIPSSIDLTNYQGEWNLVSNRSSNEPNYSTTVTISSFGNSDYVLSQLPEEGKDLYKGLYISCKTLREDTYEKETFISSLFGVTGLYDIAKNTNTNEVDLLNANFNAGGTPSFTLEYQRGLSFGDPMYYTRLEYGTLSVASGSYTYGIHLTCKDINKDTNESVYARFGVDTGTNHNGKAEIYFQQSNINNNERITLESILNRITALEQALAEKANTANPTFTGKVSVNSES